MNLFEIDRAILGLIDPETGEIMDYDSFEQLQMDRSKKLENVALWIKNLEHEAAGCRKQKEAFAERETAAGQKVRQLRELLARYLDGQKFSTDRCAVSFRRSEVVQVDDVDNLPERFVTVKTTLSPDKTAIKAALKTGEEIAGCRLETRLNAQIK